MINYWILDKDHNPIPAVDVMEWGRFFEKSDRVVARDQVGDITISTVFLGIDHRMDRPQDHGNPPILFETMIFGGEHDQYMDRCATWIEAEAMHAKAKAMVQP